MRPKLLAPAQCEAVAALCADGPGFRIAYRDFAYPLPPLVQALRTGLYPHLTPIANARNARMGLPARFPATHEVFAYECHAAGQLRPTPLLLQYDLGDYKFWTARDDCSDYVVRNAARLPLQGHLAALRSAAP